MISGAKDVDLFGTGLLFIGLKQAVSGSKRMISGIKDGAKDNNNDDVEGRPGACQL